MKILNGSPARIAVLGVMALFAPESRSELLYGLSQNTLFTFDSASPGTIGGIRPVTGLQGGESLIGIDIRPETGGLYGLGSSLRLYTLDPATGAANPANLSPFGSSTIGLNYGLDFNPVPDAVRVVNTAAQNFRVSPSGSLLANDGTLAYGVGDQNFGLDPKIAGVAYSNNNPDATTTALSGIDSRTDSLVVISPPNAGVISTKGLLGVNTTEQVGFDISGFTGIAYASLTRPGESRSGLYRIDLNTGAASAVGNIGFSSPVDGLTVVVVPEPSTSVMLMLGLTGFLLRRKTGAKTSREI
jgi:hypothetical protein